MNHSDELSTLPSTSQKVFNFKLSTGIRRKIDWTEDDLENCTARDILKGAPLAVLPREEKVVRIDQNIETGKDEDCDYFDPSITWAFQGEKGCPVSTEEISRLSKKVFSQSMGEGVKFPTRYTCVEVKDIAENRVFMYDARMMICARHFYWREENLKFENERTVLLPKNTNFGEIKWHVTICRLISGGNVKPFQRREYRRYGQEYDNVKDWTDPYIYVLYTGVSTRKGHYECFNLNEYCPPTQHGNSKLNRDRIQQLRLHELLICTPGNTPIKASTAAVINDGTDDDDDDFQEAIPRPYVRTNFAVRHALKEQLLSGSKPMIAQEHVKRTALAKGATANSLPRNRQQIYDLKRTLDEASKVQDPLWEVFKYAQTNADIIPVAGISVEKAYAAVILPAMIQHVNEILQHRAAICMHYDTTFNVGQYFVSILAYKHPHLMNQPVLPLGFLFHQSKATDVHSVFMQVISQKIPKLNSKLAVFVSDREMAIRTAIRTYFPEAYMAACHDHLTKNIEVWLKLKRIPAEVENKILKDIKFLLKAISEVEFLGFESLIIEDKVWPEEFITYYQKNLKADIFATSRFRTEPLGVYYPHAGVSNNSSESMNFIYKHFTEVERRPKTWLEGVQKAYLLMADKYNDVYLAVRLNTGDLKATSGSLEAMKDFHLSPHTDSLGSEGFESVFAVGKFVTNSDRSQINSQCLNYKNGLADWLIKMNRITIVNGQFFVRSIGDKTHAVNYIRRECTCGTENCIELMALDKVLRVDELRTGKNGRKTKSQTLTKANEKAVSKTSGKKAHVKVGVRSNVVSTQQPKKRRMDQESDNSISHSIHEHGNCENLVHSSTPSPQSESTAVHEIEATLYNSAVQNGVSRDEEIFQGAQEGEFDTNQSSEAAWNPVTPALNLATSAVNVHVKVSGAVYEKAGVAEAEEDKVDGDITTSSNLTEVPTGAKLPPSKKIIRARTQKMPLKFLETRQKSGRRLLKVQPSVNVSTGGAFEELCYCICRGGDYGKMRRCDGDSCGNEWYHVKCLRLSSKELNQKHWLCPKCTSTDTN